MNGICGWFTESGSEDAMHSAIDKMSRALTSDKMISSPREPSLAQGMHVIAGSRDNTIIHKNDYYTLALHGHPTFMGITDSEQLAHKLAESYARDGIEVLQHLHGTFSLILIDIPKRTALLAIDRLGIEPLAYSHVKDTIIFASRADAVAAHPLSSGEIDMQAIYNYLYFHCVPSPRCIYSDVCKLLPGQYLFFQDNAVHQDFYWQLNYQEPSNPSAPDLAAQLRQQLSRSVHKCTPENEPVGTFLSGGLDSSTVTKMLSELSASTVNAYGIGFDAEGYDEMEYARASAKHCNAILHEYYVTPEDVTNAIPLITASYDEPFGNASAIPAYYCALFAKQDGMKTMLAGDGGDEIFAGNARYAKQKLFEIYHQAPSSLRKYILEPVIFNMPFGSKFPPLRKIRSYIEQARIPMPDRMETYNFMHRSPLEEILHPDFLPLINHDEPAENLREVYDRTRSTSPLKRMLHLDLKITLADNDLRKVNRMCELAGIDVRYPMLDEELVDFAARVPSGMLLKGQELRSFYRKALHDTLAPSTLDKSKHGFGLPFGVWMSEYRPLQEIAYDSLSSFKRRNYLNPAYIDHLISEHRSGHAAYYGVMIWVLMMLEQWLDKHQSH